MRKFMVLLVLGVVGFAPAAIAFGDSTPTAEQQCRTEQGDANFATSHGGKTFVQFYGANTGQQNAFGKCVSSKAKAQTGSTTTTTVAATTTTAHHVSISAACRAERAAGLAAFRAKYGTHKNHANALGRCVAAKAKTQQSAHS